MRGYQFCDIKSKAEYVYLSLIHFFYIQFQNDNEFSLQSHQKKGKFSGAAVVNEYFFSNIFDICIFQKKNINYNRLCKFRKLGQSFLGEILHHQAVWRVESSILLAINEVSSGNVNRCLQISSYCLGSCVPRSI